MCSGLPNAGASSGYTFLGFRMWVGTVWYLAFIQACQQHVIVAKTADKPRRSLELVGRERSLATPRTGTGGGGSWLKSTPSAGMDAEAPASSPPAVTDPEALACMSSGLSPSVRLRKLLLSPATASLKKPPLIRLTSSSIDIDSCPLNRQFALPEESLHMSDSSIVSSHYTLRILANSPCISFARLCPQNYFCLENFCSRTRTILQR